MNTLLEKAKNSLLARNTLWAFMGQGARISIQAVYFILIARSLGAHGYGAFIGVLAFVSIMAPFASLGSGNILIKNVSRDESCFPKYWGKTLVFTFLSGALLVIVAALLSRTFLPDTIPVALVIAISLADLIFARLIESAALAYQAHQRLARASQLVVLPSVLKLLLLIGLLVYTNNPSPALWGYFYLAGALISSVAGVYLANRELGGPAFDKGIIFSEIREGIYFSVGLSSQSIYNDIDKTMLARLSTLEVTGIYGAAYRILDVSFAPINALLVASYARFFQSGANGIRGSLRFAARLFPLAAGYGLTASVVLFLAAPVVPHLFGKDFQEAVSALRWLSLLPFLKVLHYFASNLLTCSGFQGLRSICQLATAVLNVALILWLIPAYSWKGAAWASLASDSFLAITAWALVLWLRRSEAAPAIAVPQNL